MMKRILLLTLVFAMLISPVYADDNADLLHSMGLFKGTENGFELEKTATRSEAVTMLVRLLGAEKEALASTEPSGFEDAPDDYWAAKYIGYCSRNGITKGVSETEFGGEELITAQQFVTLIMRCMGYEAEPEYAFKEAISESMLLKSEADEIAGSAFIRENMVFLCVKALSTVTAEDNITLAQKLADSGVITSEQAEQFNSFDLMGRFE